MKKHKKPKRAIGKKIVKKLDIPEDIVFDIPRITTMANQEIRIENYKSIIEYEADKITLTANDIIMELFGSDFNITVITDEEISVTGNIMSINFSELGS